MTWDFGPPPADYRVLEPEPVPEVRVWVQPPVVLPRPNYAQPGRMPGTYVVPGPGGPRWFRVVPFGPR